MKKRNYLIACIAVLLCLGLFTVGYFAKDNELSAISGTWYEIESYQYGVMISGQPVSLSTFSLEIKEDGTWTVIDSFDKPVEITRGQVEKYQGAYCIYFDEEFRFVLSRKGNRLEADVQYLKGEYPEAKIVFQKGE